ncbi:cupredoxin domain-containing protein [Anaeromyxobacter oryzisoli]|uniref:cupredoxin domain-containing protein n=1 Tax=Anaeromyxobacter oryzisoli TaxID=2925408 RepID=UPI001F5820D3|nr:cupredoxin domain-containing protein [Anaeromyxobacter sp. SG63]
MTRRRAVALGAAAAAVLGIFAAVQALRTPSVQVASAAQGRAAPGPDGIQTVELVGAAGEYRPNVIHARAGQPLRLRVTLHDAHACETRLLAPDLGVDLPLRPGGSTEVVLPPAPAGSYLFTCEMKMVKGVLVYE